MSTTADRTQMLRILTEINTNSEADAPARAHTRTRNAIATDADRIEATRVTADRLSIWLAWNHMAWAHYADSVGGVISTHTPKEAK